MQIYIFRYLVQLTVSSLDSTKPKGLQSYLTLISQRARIEGFIVSAPSHVLHRKILILVHSFDYASQYPTAVKEIAAGLADGSIKRKFHIVEGLEKAPEALPMLFAGGNTGKL